MVAQTANLPNIRKLFIPDPGMCIIDCDLTGADAQVVAWEAEDEDLKTAFRAGLKLHIKNARDIFPAETKGMSDDALKRTDHAGGLYHNCKRGVHATNYGAAARTLAGKLGWTIVEAERFQRNWFGLHPGIQRWQQRVEQDLARTRSVSNKFGYRIVYFDRMQSLLPQALAWIPQSTVGLTCNKGLRKVERNLPWVEWLLQVHDSGVGQIPLSKRKEIEAINSHLLTIVPYDDPLTIQWSIKVSEVSWGNCE